MKMPRQYSLVKFNYDNLPVEYHDGYPFKKNKRYVFLGEIPNMKGHCIVSDGKGTLYTGYHNENFVELTNTNLDDYLPA